MLNLLCLSLQLQLKKRNLCLEICYDDGTTWTKSKHKGK